jgi:hypothetical protein
LGTLAFAAGFTGILTKMDSLNNVIEKQGEAKSVRKMNEINIKKELREKEIKLLRLSWKMQ